MTDKPKRLLRPKETFDRLGCGNTKGWAIIKTGALDVRKMGGATVITEESVDRFIENLPKANAA